jgi:hypothetical protein
MFDHACILVPSSQDALHHEKFLRETYNISMVVETPALLSFTQLQVSRPGVAHNSNSIACV